jgi:hypothetical protein
LRASRPRALRGCRLGGGGQRRDGLAAAERQAWGEKLGAVVVPCRSAGEQRRVLHRRVARGARGRCWAEGVQSGHVAHTTNLSGKGLAACARATTAAIIFLQSCDERLKKKGNVGSAQQVCHEERKRTVVDKNARVYGYCKCTVG